MDKEISPSNPLFSLCCLSDKDKAIMGGDVFIKNVKREKKEAKMKIQVTPIFAMWKPKFEAKYYRRLIHWIHFMTLMINDVPGYKKGMEIHLALLNFGLRIDVWWKREKMHLQGNVPVEKQGSKE